MNKSLWIAIAGEEKRKEKNDLKLTAERAESELLRRYFAYGADDTFSCDSSAFGSQR